MLIAYCRFHFYMFVHLQVFGFRVRVALIDWARLGLWWPISVMTLQAMWSFNRSRLSLTLWDPYWFLVWISMIHSHLQSTLTTNMYQWLYCYNQTPRWSRNRTSGSTWTTIFLSIPCRRQCWNTLPTCVVFTLLPPCKVSPWPCLRWSKKSWRGTWSHRRQWRSSGLCWGVFQPTPCLSSTYLSGPSRPAKTARMDVRLSKQIVS